jgi:NADH-quinone oxidoreductase subunit B
VELALGVPTRLADGRLDPAVLPRWRIVGPEGQPVDVVVLGLACCAVEAHVTGITRAADEAERAQSVLVVAGTVTERQVETVAELRASLGARVISFGACASAGGPYWDSPLVARGIEADLYVAGCPPTPDQLDEAIAQVLADG